MKKKLSFLYCIIFVIMIILPPITIYIFGGKDQENSENREMTKLPNLTLENIGEYPKEYDKYYEDNMPFRSYLIYAKGFLDLKLFNQSPNDKVIIGKDGWLFYHPNGTDGDTIADYQGTKLYTDEQLTMMKNNLLHSKEALEKQGRELVILIAPNKESMYGSEFLPDYYERNFGITKADQVVNYLRENTDITVVYSKETIENAKKEYPQYTYYCEFGTHWNYLGAYLGAKDLLNEFNIHLPQIDSISINNAEGTDRGLVDMMGLTGLLTNDTEYEITGFPGSNDITEFGTHDQWKFNANDVDERKVLLVGDSYAKWLVPFMSSQFSSYYSFHRNNYSNDLLIEQDPDIVVFEVVERYMGQLINFDKFYK